MTERALPKLLIIILGMWLITGCTPPTPPPSPTPLPSSTPVTTDAAANPSATPRVTAGPAPSPAATRAPLLPTDTPAMVTINVWQNLSEGQAAQLARDVQAFQTEFPQYRVALHHYDTPENFMTPLMAGDTDFDVVLAASPLLGNLWRAGQLAPLDNFFSPGFLDNFAAIALAGATANNEVWGLPETMGFHLLLFYNRELVDTPPATLDELTALSQSLSDSDQRALGLNSYDPLWLTPWLAAHGGWLTNEAGEPQLNTPAMTQTLAMFAGWHSGEAPLAPLATYDEMQKKFLEGDLATMVAGDWALAELLANRKVDWGVARLPAAGSGDNSQPAAPLVLGKYWAVSQATAGEQAQAVSAFLEYMTRPERQLAWTARFGQLPTRRSALDDPLIVNDAARRVSAAQVRAGRTLPLGVNPNLLLDAMREPLRALLQGNLTPEAAAAQMQANLTR